YINKNNRFILSVASKNEILLWDLSKNNNNISTLVTKNDLLHPVIEISPDGSVAAVSNYSKDNWIYLWDLNSKLHIGSFKGHTDWVTSLTFSPDGNYLVSGSEDETIRVWDVKTKKAIKILKDHQDNINSVVFSNNGKFLASGGDDGRVFIWDANELMPELKIFSANYDLKYGLAKEFEEEKQKEISLLNDMFKPKGEFETTEEYNARITKANEDKNAIEDKYSQKLQEYMVSKQSELEKLNEEKKEADVEKQKELDSKIESSVKDTIVNIASIGTYDADNNILPVTVKGKSGKISILRSEAQSLKENWKKTKAKSKMKLREDLKTYEYFDIIVIHPLTNNEYKLEY
ncbi:MAG: hypothetical protein IAE90_10280, partial [Ignavibacteria bacterium]|nr:hypothetical protein [Ignavibacteria bacterium]